MMFMACFKSTCFQTIIISAFMEEPVLSVLSHPLDVCGSVVPHPCKQGDVLPSRNSIQSSLLLQNIIYFF